MRSQPHSGLNFQGKIIALWTTFLLGMLFHTQLALMPLFHGIDVTQSHTHEYLELSSILWLMLGIFALPMLAIVAIAFTASRRFRQLHFGLTVFFTVSNLLHFVSDVLVSVPSYQLFLMALLFAIGLLLNLVSYQWIREGNRDRQLFKAVL
ncbi:hypothetical protein C1752_08671 [Acaryochloris thomasi RCC1774]|uniref:Uncharacterized protein n=1 Tax=Acaryochloris thomasi RCC1774 TaxID=1764569 RepID=A0A2W1JA65_9CYAN|nr:hypothetical protein [Acaryochloris thomasi]PZD70896.1 hypothetical protein C1752_08671 [Acaryochloris thomasi RCC1774]